MKHIILALALLVGLLLTSGAHAASYLRTDGVVVDPILATSGSVLPYRGRNLEPHAYLRYANLYKVNLTNADLSYATLANAILTDANLTNADLTYANLSGAWLSDANLTNADLSYANLTGAQWLSSTSGSPFYNTETDFTGAWSGGSGSALFDPVAAGWRLAPEPNGMLPGIAPLT